MSESTAKSAVLSALACAAVTISGTASLASTFRVGDGSLSACPRKYSTLESLSNAKASKRKQSSLTDRSTALMTAVSVASALDSAGRSVTDVTLCWNVSSVTSTH
jgi:hypothetical protein